MEEEILRREKEVRTGAKPNPAVDSERAGSEQEGSSEVSPTLSKEQRRAIWQQYHTTPESTPDILDITADELREIQDRHPTLMKVREVADGKLSTAGVGFFKREGIIYRKWIPPGRGDKAAIEQLVLPTQCRQTVLELAHNVPIAGHLGKEKMRQRVLCRFYWATVFRDIENFCQSCVTCQKATHRGVRQAPLIPLPVISVPFSRIAMDIVGPLPRSRTGNRYILVLCDYTARYPEAIPLCTIDAEHIAEQLFARVGVPQEILTDQGSNFTLQLLAELYRLLHVQSILTIHKQTVWLKDSTRL